MGRLRVLLKEGMNEVLPVVEIVEVMSKGLPWGKRGYLYGTKGGCRMKIG